MELNYGKKICILFLLLTLYSHTCFSTGLPITGMNAYELIERTNAFLLADKQNFLCTKPMFRNTVENKKLFISYVDKMNPYQPINGTIILLESLSGETLGICMSVKSKDKAKYRQVGMTFIAMMRACGLSEDETLQFLRSVNFTDETTLQGTIWNHRLNRYYTLNFPPNDDGIFTYMLMASDRI